MSQNAHNKAVELVYDAARKVTDRDTTEAAGDIIEHFGADPHGPSDLLLELAMLSPELFGPAKLREYALKIENMQESTGRILDNLNLR